MEGKVLDITLSQFLVGRDPQCQLRPASPLISKRHCAIIQRDGKAFIRDFDSTNGTLVNDEPVQGERELHHDDRLKIGPLLFAVQIDTTTPSPATRGKTPLPSTKPAPKPKTSATPAPATKAVKQPAKPSTPPSKPTPAAPPPEPAPAASAADSFDSDDDMMALLLSGSDETGSSENPGEVPDGSTIMDMKVPDPLLPGGQAKKDEKPKDNKFGDTRAAAASILEKMTRRNRN